MHVILLTTKIQMFMFWVDEWQLWRYTQHAPIPRGGKEQWSRCLCSLVVRHPPRENKIWGSNPAFHDWVMPLVLWELPCLTSAITGSVLGLDCLMSVYCDWLRKPVWSATSVSVWQHVQSSKQVHTEDTLFLFLGCSANRKQSPKWDIYQSHTQENLMNSATPRTSSHVTQKKDYSPNYWYWCCNMTFAFVDGHIYSRMFQKLCFYTCERFAQLWYQMMLDEILCMC